MKRCPKCGQNYTDENINFCLIDGELLSRQVSSFDPPYRQGSADDSPPTVVLDQARVTNPTGWSAPVQPPAQWQPQRPQQSFYPYILPTSPNQTLGIISLVTGVMSLTIGWCCYLGVLLGPAAMITGIVALVQSNSNPERYGGRGFAIGGIVTGVLALFGIIIFIAFIAATS